MHYIDMICTLIRMHQAMNRFTPVPPSEQWRFDQAVPVEGVFEEVEE